MNEYNASELVLVDIVTSSSHVDFIGVLFTLQLYSKKILLHCNNVIRISGKGAKG